ncbi:hypothetical protein LAZ67_11002921 [Cordylochernes scorpioides]|uniref:Uncharacterized protein n=1 Tax=Cordylochernes scorpioides TaxID=51811 RepID=A0ABY6KZJ6_9ARAC|nr:hypothetical protein LAZ67_11002921 [Cordylochernes scorpioides]
MTLKGRRFSSSSEVIEIATAEGALDSINTFINDGLKHRRKTVSISLGISHDKVQRHTIIQGLRDLNCPEELIQPSASSVRDRKVIYQASTLTATLYWELYKGRD